MCVRVRAYVCACACIVCVCCVCVRMCVRTVYVRVCFAYSPVFYFLFFGGFPGNAETWPDIRHCCYDTDAQYVCTCVAIDSKVDTL